MKHHVPTRSDETEVIIPGTVLNQYIQRTVYGRTEIIELTHTQKQV